MALTKKEENRVVAKVFMCLSTVAAVVLLVVGVALWKVGAMAVSETNKGLVAQKIYFPPAGSPVFSAAAYPDIQSYGGKQVTDGGVAKVYAEKFLGEQLKLMAGGKTLSEVSAQLAVDPTNMQLQQLQGAMFQAEMSKGTLLADAYGTWTQGNAYKTIGAVSLGLAMLLTLVAGAKYMYYKRS